jgi:hypothetical protein
MVKKISPQAQSEMPLRTMSSANIRRVLKGQVSLFKYGVMVPRNDSEADRSPERRQWRAGRDLEWMRLTAIGAFDGTWTLKRLREEFPKYLDADIGSAFFIYDYKFSGEHRVRLVFDGSKQSLATYTNTYAPTVRSDSVRIFHCYCVELRYPIQQWDVPQAFLQSEADCTIFLRPPRGYAEFPGQLILLLKSLYGEKQAAYLWYTKLDAFLTSIGFESSVLDACFYKRREPSGDLSLVICHVDDFRAGASAAVLKTLHAQLFDEWKITTCSGLRFLGMDMEYNMEVGQLTMRMTTYISETIKRFESYDTTHGLPYRELVGCLMWIVLCVHGTSLMKVKDLAGIVMTSGKRTMCVHLQCYMTCVLMMGLCFVMVVPLRKSSRR